MVAASAQAGGAAVGGVRRRGGDGTNTLYDTKDAVLDCSAYLKIVFGALLGMAYAKMQTVGLAHFIVGGLVLGSIPMVLSQHWLKHPPEKSIEWGGPFALASDGIGAGLASLVGHKGGYQAQRARVRQARERDGLSERGDGERGDVAGGERVERRIRSVRRCVR